MSKLIPIEHPPCSPTSTTEALLPLFHRISQDARHQAIYAAYPDWVLWGPDGGELRIRYTAWTNDALALALTIPDCRALWGDPGVLHQLQQLIQALGIGAQLRWSESDCQSAELVDFDVDWLRH